MMQPRFRALISTGGIGYGSFFALDGEHTLGREESRTGRFLDRRDYCKLHIVSHYVARLMGPGFSVIPIGRVGDDEVGQTLLGEMAGVGLDLRHVQSTPGTATMSALCLVYPDGSGGNLTTADSACAQVDGPFVAEASAEFARFTGQGMAVALPEVPLTARRTLLELGTQHRFLRLASFNSTELRELRKGDQIGCGNREEDWLQIIDLLALNLDEAAALTGLQPERTGPADIVDATLGLLASLPRPVMATITAGGRGSWSSDGMHRRHLRALDIPTVSTAGAGDAHLAGTIAGLAAGLSLVESHELGVLVAAMSVTSPHTIHKGICRATLRTFASQRHVSLSAPVVMFLEDPAGTACP